MHLILIGMRGSGKTTVGRLAAQLLDRPFVDIDERVVLRTGETISSIFATSGEPAFRALEAAVIEQALGERPCVISVGGGAVLSDENRRRMRAGGHCIWLRAAAETLAARISADPATRALRPSLTGQAPAVELETLLRVRQPLYEQVACASVNTDTLAVAEVAALVVRRFRDCG